MTTIPFLDNDNTIEGRVDYDNLSKTPINEFTAEFQTSEGVEHVRRVFIKYKNIFYGEGGEENPVREKGSSSSNIKDLAESRHKGIPLDSARPVVEENNIVDIVGDSYLYEANDGITRYKADCLNNQGDNGDVFDVVRFHDTIDPETGEVIRSARYNKYIYLHKLNDAQPREVHTVNDIVLTMSQLISRGDLKKEEPAIKDAVYECATNLDTSKKNDAVRKVLFQEDVPTQTRSWRDKECKDWYETKCVDSEEVDYFFPDKYFIDRIFNVLKQYFETGKVQVIAEHVNNKGDSPEIVELRRKQADEMWDLATDVFKKVAAYGNNQLLLNGEFKLPVERKFWMPQIQSGDDKEQPNSFIRR